MNLPTGWYRKSSSEIADAQASIAAEALTPVRDETTDKDPNYEWARMELEKAQVQWDGLRARQSDAAAQVASLRQLAQQMQSESVDQQDLMRAAKADEDNFLLYLRKREEARIGDALDERHILNVAIVEPPAAPALPVHSVCFVFPAGLRAGHGVQHRHRLLARTILTRRFALLTKLYGLLEVPVLAWLPAAEPASALHPSSRIGRIKVGSPVSTFRDFLDRRAALLAETSRS